MLIRTALSFVFALAIGCDPAPPPPITTPVAAARAPEPKAEARSRQGEAKGIHYLEIAVGGARLSQPLPMIVAIHGLGDSPEGFRTLLEDFDRPARLVIPRAIDKWDEGWSWFPFRARDPDVEALAKGIEAAAIRLAPAIETISKERPTVGRPIVTGFSQGGMLSFALVSRFPHSIGLAIPIGGLLPPPLLPTRRSDEVPHPRVIALHGDADNAVPIEGAREAVEALSIYGWPAELHVYPGVKHMIPSEMRAELHALLREYLDRELPAP